MKKVMDQQSKVSYQAPALEVLKIDSTVAIMEGSGQGNAGGGTNNPNDFLKPGEFPFQTY